MGRTAGAWLPVVIYGGLILGLSSIPAASMPPGRFWDFDKLIHGAEYALLGALMARALIMSGRHGLVFALAAIAATAAFGAADELYQTTVPGRHGSVFDAIADGVGGSIGVAFSSFYHRHRRRN